MSDFGQGGAVGSFARAYDLMADSAIEVEAVTAAREVHTINQYNDPGVFGPERRERRYLSCPYQIPHRGLSCLPIHVYTFVANFTEMEQYGTSGTKNKALREILIYLAQNQV